PSITPFAVFRAGQRTHLVIAAGTNGQFAQLCRVLGRPELAEDARFGSNRRRTDNQPALSDALEAALAARPAEVWLELLEAAGVPCGPINDIPAVVADPQVAARAMVVPVDDPALPGLLMAGNPIKLNGAEPVRSWPPAPELDADRAAILAELDLPPTTRPPTPSTADS
ncbi:MAG: CoA transferase, partial [Actinomycetota bacterium]|nr:CoA transferase [Actinomycetota bacterium]